MDGSFVKSPRNDRINFTIDGDSSLKQPHMPMKAYSSAKKSTKTKTIKKEVTPPLIDFDVSSSDVSKPVEPGAPLTKAAKAKQASAPNATTAKPKKKDWDDDAWDLLNQ
ncbi:hypothetical protein Tcan_02479 [Toxocara canis]|uniref:Uncharacterized protein n=1 Tax=Toxocara canis TaxID=6265 RepID=A0A0B2UJ73_TOXCA|nr:hypothetical protein Tcan_02479 [Toxocara canis]